MITILATLVLAQAWPGEPPPEPPIRPRVFRSEGANRVSRLGSDDYAFFEFAPTSGAGMGATCGCVNPTGASGQALTFTRASSGMCTVGNTTTGIANGDLVLCSTDQARVMPGGDGTGAKGLLVEAARQNKAVRSQEIDNASWVKIASGVAVPTVTADYAVAPDGTTTAERVEIPATSAAQYSIVGQNSVFTGSVLGSASVYIKGTSGSGTTCIGMGDYAVTFNYVSTSWTRVLLENVTPPGSVALYIGNYGAVGTGNCAGQARAAQDFLMWGGQAETAGAAYATSYIPTTSAAVTRAQDFADVVFATAFAPTAGLSVAGTSVVYANSYVANVGVFPFALSAGAAGGAISSPYWWPYTGATDGKLAIDTAGVVSAGAATYAPVVSALSSTTFRQASYHTGTLLNICQEGVCEAGAASTFGTPSFARVRIGAASAAAGSQMNLVAKQLCISPDSSRCR